MIGSASHDESARLAALRDFEVLDTAPDPALDEIAQLAARICDAPIALIALVDERRQWFKATVGLDVVETSRELSFCSQAIAGTADIFEVPDALADDRFAANPLVSSAPHIRFYAGAPLQPQGGHRLGTLCVLDRQPRRLTKFQSDALLVLSRAVVTHLELQRQTRQLSQQLSAAEQSRRALLSVLEDEQRTAVELRETEERFRQAQKMEAIGQLAGGIAHDFNNILTVIMGQVEFTHDAAVPPDVRQGLDDIRLAAARAANLTRQLLVFSRRQVMQLKDADLNDIVSAIARMLHRIIGEDVKLEQRLTPAPVVVCVDAGMIDQVLMNLAVNARDAMPSGGRLLIETDVVEIDAATAARLADGASGTYARLRLSDTGSGIPADVLPRIFEPFFTTKEAGKGTGLGLATVFGIVKQHRGWIDADSAPDAGTTFTIYLPLSTADAAVVERAAGRPRPTAGSETLLLVEDDRAVRTLMRRILEKRGYRVREAASGDEALIDIGGSTIDLLLTDLVMPGDTSGQELARQLTKQRPDLKVIFMSGYSADIAGTTLNLTTGQNFIEKPFAPNRLLELVRKVLDS